MKVLVFGASGMVGQGVLRECLRDAGVREVVSVGRKSSGMRAAKLREVMVADVFETEAYAGEMHGVDGCLFCVGVSSFGMGEEAYRRVTYALTMRVAEALVRASPEAVFCYVSGVGTNARGWQMWARVKGATEEALGRLGFRAVYLFRPGVIFGVGGERPRTWFGRRVYAVMAPLVRRLAPSVAVTTEQVGRAMLRVVRESPEERVMGIGEIARFGG